MKNVDYQNINLIDKLLCSYFTPVMLKKNEYLVEQGKVCAHFCYIASGILQHATTVNGNDTTTYLSLKNSFTSSLKSFLTETPSRKHIKALTTTHLWIISLKDFIALRNDNSDFRALYYNLIENQICLIDEYRIDLLALSPEERYKKLLCFEPLLLQEVPLHYLASFLGISTRHMSRIRKKI